MNKRHIQACIQKKAKAICLMLNILVGITSWGIDCAVMGYPGVYTIVSSQIRFLQSVIPKNSFETLNNVIVNENLSVSNETEVALPLSCEQQQIDFEKSV